MAPQRTAQESNVPARQVNSILQNLRGEHFRHARNVQGRPASSSSLSSHAHNQPTLPADLIYPSPDPVTSPSWVPGPNPPRSWGSPASSAPNSTPLSIQVKDAAGVAANTPAWRERALSPLFSTGATPDSESACPRLTYPDPSPVPQLTLLCLRLVRVACPGADLAQVVPYIPPHLRRTLLRDAAIHAPLSQTELDALCHGTAHVDTELVVVGPYNTLRGSTFRKNEHTTDLLGHPDNEPDAPWDALQTQDSEPLALCSLAVLSSPLSAATVLAFPPTITHLALVNIPQRIPLQRLPAICPLLVLLDLSYNPWLHSREAVDRGRPMLEEVGWGKWRRLEVLGLRACLVTPMLLLELNRGRWEDVRVVQ